MRIDDANLKNIASQPAKVKEPNRVESGYGKVRDGSTDPASGATDTFVLSSLSAAINSQSEGSPERTAKLDKLAKEVDSGRYKPDSAATANKLIKENLALGRQETKSPEEPKNPE